MYCMPFLTAGVINELTTGTLQGDANELLCSTHTRQPTKYGRQRPSLGNHLQYSRKELIALNPGDPKLNLPSNVHV